MPRPLKCRRVAFVPGATYFKPAGIPMSSLEEIQLTLEEAEALRLKDLEGLDQETAAAGMNISRSTFQRVLAAARRKIAEALLNGRAVRIAGGNFEMASRRLRCQHGHEWDTSYKADDGTPELCPTCNDPGVSSPPVVKTGSRDRVRGGRRIRT
jgi:predicted DNA-binding protein (UPF0251 family)